MKRPTLKQWDGIVIEWYDIVGSGGEWCSVDEDEIEPAICQQRGYIYAGWTRKAQRLRICAAVTEGTISHRDAIPWGCVKSIIIESRKVKGEWEWEMISPRERFEVQKGVPSAKKTSQ